MPSYKQIADTALQELGITVRPVGLTDIALLTWATEAEEEIQGITNAVQAQLDLQIGTTADGSYAIDSDIKNMNDVAYYTMNPIVPGSGSMAATIAPYDRWLNVQRNWNMPIMPTPYGYVGPIVDPSFSRNQIYVAYDRALLWLYPYLGVTGTLRIRYAPKLAKFDTDAAILALTPGVRWSGWLSAGNTFNTGTYNVVGPDFKLSQAFSGITAYVKKKILESLPNGIGLRDPRYAMCEMKFEEAKTKVFFADSPNEANVDFTLNFSGLP